MQKIITLTALFFMSFATFIQAQFLLGGNIGFSAQKATDEFGGDKEETKVASITFIPRLAYRIENNWVGVDAGITSIKLDEPDFGGGRSESRLNLVSVSPFFRMIKKPTDNFGIWLEAQAGVGFGKSTFEGEDEEKYALINAGLRPGVIFFIGNNLSFEASFGRFGFSRTTVEDAQDSDDRQTNSDFGFSLNNNSLVLGSFLGDGITLTNGFLFGVNWAF